MRIASFNAALNRRNPGELVQDLRLGGVEQIDRIAEIIQRARPDVILINEIDHDERGIAADLFRETLKSGRGDAAGIDYPHLYLRPSNTGVLAEVDLDGDGILKRPGDTQGFGYFEGQYAMAVLSRLPFDEDQARSFQKLLWSDMPRNILPYDHYGEAAGMLRLSSKSHWDVPVILPDGRRLHLLASHPTPPVFDGPEDRNGRRNHDEIRFWVDYISGDGWMVDDAGRQGALPDGAGYVIVGDLNNDPSDGDGHSGPVMALLNLAQDPKQASPGALEEAELGGNKRHDGDPNFDTADWRDQPGPGNLRVDYALPSKDWEIVGGGVFWPSTDDALHWLVGSGGEVSSDHRLVWVDVK